MIEAELRRPRARYEEVRWQSMVHLPQLAAEFESDSGAHTMAEEEGRAIHEGHNRLRQGCGKALYIWIRGQPDRTDMEGFRKLLCPSAKRQRSPARVGKAEQTGLRICLDIGEPGVAGRSQLPRTQCQQSPLFR